MPDLFEGVLLFARKPITQPQDQLFARRQGADQGSDPRSHAVIVDSTVGKRRALIGDEVFETFFCAGDIRLQRDGFSRKPIEGFQGVGVRSEGGREFRRSRIAAELARQLRADTLASLKSIVHMGREPNGSGVILDRSDQGLANPPDSVGGELEATAVIEFFDRPDQSEIAFLDQIREGQAEVSIILCDSDHEFQIVFDEAVLHRGHLIVGILDGVREFEHSFPRHAHFALELRESFGSLASASHLLGSREHGISQLHQDGQGELCSVHFL